MHFWIATLIRGALALVIGSAALVIPDMATTLLLLPFALAVSILCLGVYGVLDSAIVFVTSFMASSRPPQIALRLQGTVGVIIGVILFAIVFDSVRLQWFLYLIALQSLCAAVAEFMVARHAFTRSTCLWNYAVGTVALIFTVAYSLTAIFKSTLQPRQAAWLIYGYLLAFGLTQCLTAARMLYADRKFTSPAQ